MPHHFAICRTASQCSDGYLGTFSAAQDARWSSHQADLAICLFYHPTQTSGKLELCDHARSRRMPLSGSKPEVLISRAPVTECLHAHARVCYARRRPSLYGSLTGRERRRPLRQAYPVPVWLWAVVPDLYCTGRWFKLECELRFASVRSSDELVVRVSPPDPDSCQMVLAQGLFMVRRQSSRFAARSMCTVALRACMGVAHARHSPVSLRIGPSPLRRIIYSLRFPQSFEMRVAQPNLRFSTVENRVTYTPANMHLSIGMTGNPR